MLKLFKYFRWQDWILFACVVALITGQVWLDLKLPDYMQAITVEFTLGTATTNSVLINGAWMLACTLGSTAFAVLTGFIVAKMTTDFSARIRQAVFCSIQDYSLSEIKKFSTPSLITRTTNDVSQIQMTTAMGMQVIIKAPIMAIWTITKITSKSWQWSLTAGVAVAFLIATIAIVVVFAFPKFKKIQTLTDNINKVTRENLSGVRVVRAFNAEKYEEKKFEKANSDLTKTNLFAGRLMSILSPVMTFVMSMLSMVIYWVGAAIINSASLFERAALFGDMVVFMNYAVQLVMSFIMMAMIFILLPRAMVSAKRINEVLQTKSTIKDGKNISSSSKKGEVEFQNVSFKYPDAEEYVLKNVSFKANRGETVAFIGSTGSGKSTLINLVPRLYDATEGIVLVDGEDVATLNQNALRKKIGYVSQNAAIFSGTVLENISLGQDNPPEKEIIDQALQIAQANEFVEKLEGKHNHMLAQNGTNISGGQKQRISIARALAWQPEILIFDDSFSALDFSTDKKLRKELSKLDSVTKLVVAQRIGTIKNADQIVVLSDGEVVGIGKHDDLLETCPVYKEIALSQLSKEEL